MAKFNLILLIHAHQPVGNFDDVLERAYARAYLPFLDSLLQHPSISVGLHYSGSLLEWLERHHPDFFDLLRVLLRRRQVELIGGGFYEPILIAIPPEDRHKQLSRQSDYLERHFGRRPAGAWLAERVWEPQLPSILAQAGIEYTLVDDIHFLASGFDVGQLHGYYVAEDLGATVKLIPGLKALRYLIPYRSPEENLAFLRAAAEQHPGGFAAMGDDCEKFGVWPRTYDHCYRDGWLEKFLLALEANSHWLSVTLPGEYLATHRPLARADLPTASYTEMTEWALPTSARQRFHALQQEFSNRPEVQTFLRGSFWRNFLSKYAEANLLHKKMLHVSAKVRAMGSGAAGRGQASRRAREQATTHLLRAQCNDAYWHGVFGGIYAPHLRAALWRELIRAEKLADAAAHTRASHAAVERLDFDADGRDELYATSPLYAALLKPSDGATLAALDFRASDVALINSMERRPEPYHARLREAPVHGGEGVVSIHAQVRVKEEGLERGLRYDRWPRHAFRLLLFPTGKTYADYETLRLEESAAFAGGEYAVARATGHGIVLWQEAPLGFSSSVANAGPVLRVEKTFAFRTGREEFVVSCDAAARHRSGEPVSLRAGLELVINFLAANQPDRYFEYSGQRHSLLWSAAVPASQMRVVDEWQSVAVAVEAPGAHEFWVAPIETISESEEGFERVYQGSQILAVWRVELAPGATWRGQVSLRVGLAR